MNRDSFERLIGSEPALAPHVDFLRGLLKPCVRITITPDAPTGTQSQFGGKPMVPANFAWPQHASGLYYFLGQINFAEMVERPVSLPATGLLSLFYVDYDPESDYDGELFWGNDGYVKAWYFEDVAALVQVTAPHGKTAKAKRIALAGEFDIPRHGELREDWPFDFETLDTLLADDGAWQGKLVPNALLATDYLLGYPSYYSLGYDPTPGDSWIVLLTLHSHETFKWCWHDGDKLMVFIESERLAARDFSNLKSDAG